MLKYTINKDAVVVTSISKAGAEASVTLVHDKGLTKDQTSRTLKTYVKGMASVRAAAATFIDALQQTGKMESFKSGGVITKELLALTRNIEDAIGKEWGFDEATFKSMRSAGQYADTRSLALKCWVHGVAVRQDVDAATGIPVLLTTDAMRKIVAAHRKAPEATAIDDVLDKLEEMLADKPTDIDIVQRRIAKILDHAKSLLDQSAKQDEAKEKAEAVGATITPPVSEPLAA